jgi:aspartyl protease family protein
VKLTTSTLILFLGIWLYPGNLLAQEQNDCFMLDANGDTVNLGDLCNDSGSTLSNPDIFEIPIKRREANIAVIEVVFNNQHPFEMLLDTGASGTVVTAEMAKVLQIQVDGITLVSTAGGVIQAGVGQVNSIAAGGITVENVDVVIVPNLPIGLLGQDFFGNYDIVIKQNSIEFHVRK